MSSTSRRKPEIFLVAMYRLVIFSDSYKRRKVYFRLESKYFWKRDNLYPQHAPLTRAITWPCDVPGYSAALNKSTNGTVLSVNNLWHSSTVPGITSYGPRRFVVLTTKKSPNSEPLPAHTNSACFIDISPCFPGDCFP
jgi:hypothetical protein